MTLAPERPGAIEFIRRATAAGVVVGARPHRRRSARRFASRGRGRRPAEHAPGQRHRLAAAAAPEPDLGAGGDRRRCRPRSSPTAITSTWRRCACWRGPKGPAQTILVSDASPLAGLPPGVYGEWAVDPRARSSWRARPTWPARIRGSKSGVRNLLAATGWTLEQALAAVTTNPARLLGRPEPRLAAGEPGDLVIFRSAGAGRIRA